MKNFSILILVMGITIIPVACNAQNHAQLESEVKAFIVGETEAFQNNDYEKSRQFTSESAKTAVIQRLPDGRVSTSIGGVSIEGAKGSSEKMDYIAMGFKVLERSNWNINARKNVAWVNYRQKTTLGGAEYVSDEIRVLEKENGEWKIVLSSTIVH